MNASYWLLHKVCDMSGNNNINGSCYSNCVACMGPNTDRQTEDGHKGVLQYDRFLQRMQDFVLSIGYIT